MIAHRAHQKRQQAAGLADAIGRVVEPLSVIAEHLANGGPRMPAGEGVVADVGNALRIEIVAADREDFFLHLLRHPGIDAVAEDVVEGAQLARNVEDAEASQVDIHEAQLAHTRWPSLICRSERSIPTRRSRATKGPSESDCPRSRSPIPAHDNHPAARAAFRTRGDGADSIRPRLRKGETE